MHEGVQLDDRSRARAAALRESYGFAKNIRIVDNPD